MSGDKAVVLPVLAPGLDCGCCCCDSRASFINSLLLLLDRDTASLLKIQKFLFII
jgi:hypothetical protein